ncbi:MAG: M28 family peptidase [Prevotella sp.]|nr:M28 family peptidase [Prevotella sp.]
MKKIICVVCIICGLFACSTTKKSEPSVPVVSIDFCADTAYAFCEAQCQFGPRTMNSQAHEQCGAWIADKFRQFGYTVTLQRAHLRGYDGTVLESTNIVATATNGVVSSPSGGELFSSPDSAASATVATEAAQDIPRILVCAHWDSRPWADNDPDSANWHKPVMAANDGASGVAVMLELARLLQQHDSARIAVDFICFDAEDWGIPMWEDRSDGDSWALGAQHWAAHPEPLAPSRYQYGILLDMVGGQGARFFQEGYSMRHARSVVDKVWQAAVTAGYGSFFPTKDGGWITDDHVPLNEQARIPCIDIISHYPDCEQSNFGPTWHTVSDDMQHIDRTTLKAVGQTLVQLIFSE